MREFEDGEVEYLRLRMKQELRRRMKVVRKALPSEARAARSEAIIERLRTELRDNADNTYVAAFVSIRGEVSLAPLLDGLPSVALPRVTKDGLVLHALESRVADLEPYGRYQIPEPSPDAAKVDPDDVGVVLVPALAIDPRGYRVGYGGGYYDRLLPTLSNAIRIAVVYDFQLVPETPNMPHDVPVHVVVTDQRKVDCV